MLEILGTLEKHESLSFEEILSRVKIARGVVEKALKLLEVDGAVGTIFNGKVLYFRTPNPWQPDTQRVERILSLRRTEQSQMQSYMEYKGCLMEFLLKALDDRNPKPWVGVPIAVEQTLTKSLSRTSDSAEDFQLIITIDPHKRWPAGVFLDQETIPPRCKIVLEDRQIMVMLDGEIGAHGKIEWSFVTHWLTHVLINQSKLVS
jgi:ATP-dependent DNA helicase RecQ